MKITQEKIKKCHPGGAADRQILHREEDSDRCLGALGRLPGGGSTTQAAQPNEVLVCAACRGQTIPYRSQGRAPHWTWGYLRSCLLDIAALPCSTMWTPGGWWCRQ